MGARNNEGLCTYGNGAQTPEELIALRRHGWSLEQQFYTDEAIFRAEMERIFRRGWLFAGHTFQIPRPGDYFTYEIDTESIIVTRGHDEKIYALFNTCRHRGSRICRKPSGHVKRLVCPYHQWTYDLDGKLLKTTWMPEDFKKSQFGLHLAHVRELAGLIFISLADTPPSFDDAHDHIAAVLRPHGFDRAKIAYILTHDIKANWKLVVENQRECYHCPGNHKVYMKVHYDAEIDNAEMRKEIEARAVECRARWQAHGFDDITINSSSAYTGNWYRANRTPFRKGYVTESLDGQPLAPLMGDFTERDMGTGRANTYLNFWCHACSDHAVTTQLTPIDAATTRSKTHWLVHKDAVEGVDYDLDRLIEFTTYTRTEDWEIVENQHRGVLSSRYQPGPYSSMKEAHTEMFVQWCLDQITT